jgi:ribonuclease VapC
VIIDTSAVSAIFFKEPDAARFAEKIAQADTCSMSTATFVELSMVIESQLGQQALRECDRFLDRAGVALESVTAEQAHLARQAFLDYGKGRHPARLNFGDCFSYALAKVMQEPLLFKGNDFRKTDIEAAL